LEAPPPSTLRTHMLEGDPPPISWPRGDAIFCDDGRAKFFSITAVAPLGPSVILTGQPEWVRRRNR